MKWFFDVGHGGTDPGAVGNGLQEKNVNLKLALATRDYLKDYDVEIVMSRTTDVNDPSTTSVQRANRVKADILISFHHNAFNNATANGFETFRHTRNDVGSRQLQNAVHTAMARELKSMGVRDRGQKTAGFLILRDFKGASVLLEPTFITNISDANVVKRNDYNTRLAKAIGDSLVSLYSLKKRAKPTPIPPLPNPTPSPKPPKEDNDMLENAIVINGLSDFPVAEPLANRLQAPIFIRSALRNLRAKNVYIVGGNAINIPGENHIVLSGSNRFETAVAVYNFLNK